MKSEKEIRAELERQYKHRLGLRLERKLKNCCRNCAKGVEQEFNLGEFGIARKCICSDNLSMEDNCPSFVPIHTAEAIEQEMIEDLKNPADCGAKEPKIAALLWVLQNKEA